MFFLMQLAGAMGDGLAWMADISPCALFDAYGLAAGEASAVADIALVGVIAIALDALAVAVFTRRDFSL